MRVPKPHEIEMPTGHYVDVGDPWNADIRVEDIAHKLAQTNRFGGAGAYPYSVAQHVVLCARRALALHHTSAFAYAMLHHDDGEYIATDIQKPVKIWLEEGSDLVSNQRTLGDLEDMWQEVIAERLGVPLPPKERIKEIDTWAVLVEAKNLLPSGGKHWAAAEAQKQWRLAGGKLPESGLRTPSYWRGEMHWAAARDEYLELHHELRGALT